MQKAVTLLVGIAVLLLIFGHLLQENQIQELRAKIEFMSSLKDNPTPR